MRVIGFAGLGQAGKTTAVDEICKWCFERGGKMDPKRLHFAGPIKDALECMGAVKFSARDELYRKGAQLIGTKFRDPEFVPGVTHNDYWVELLSEKIAALEAEEDARLSKCGNEPLFRETLILIDDIRFENELNVLRRWGARVIFIDGFRRLAPTINEPWRKHVSEQMATDYTYGHNNDEMFDTVITNNEDEKSFRRVIYGMASTWSGLTAQGRLDD